MVFLPWFSKTKDLCAQVISAFDLNGFDNSYAPSNMHCHHLGSPKVSVVDFVAAVFLAFQQKGNLRGRSGSQLATEVNVRKLPISLTYQQI